MSKLHQIAGCENANRKADVVFVHGLGGDALETWRHGIDASSSWPHWLAQDFPDVGVWSLGYAASPSKLSRFWPGGNRDAGHSMALPDRALQSLDLMIHRGLGERPLFFIGHSLGGLVVKQILRKSADDQNGRLGPIFMQTKAVLYLATPHSGATLASLADAFRVAFGATVTIQDLAAHDPALRDLFGWYRNHAQTPAIQTTTYFELRGFRGMTIVNPTSAHPGVGTDPVGLDEDHISIAKPRDRDAQVYLAACAMLRECLTPSKPKAANVPAQQLSQLAPTVTVKLDSSIAARLASFPKPNEAPPRADQFFGRQAQLSKLIQRLRSRQNTAVVGAAGMGKTALAAKALLEVVGETAKSLVASSFPDGVVFLDLYALEGSAEAFWDRLANKLAGPIFLEKSPSRQRASSACHARDILVVIEGGEEADGQDGHAPISELLSILSPQNRWLLLTRLSTQAPVTAMVELKTALDPEDAAHLFDHITEGRLPPALRTQALDLLEGHPLAITWAANLLARDDDDPKSLLNDWSAEQLPSLTDPTQAEHTLQWLFDRSVRGLEAVTRQALDAAGLLAPRPFPLAALAAALGDVEHAHKAARLSLKELAHRSLLTKLGDTDNWQFTHVLTYRFARKQAGADTTVPLGLARWLGECFQVQLKEANTLLISTSLEHFAALLLTDTDQALWTPLVNAAIYEYATRLEELGNLLHRKLLLNAVISWFDRLPPELAQESDWLRERSVLNSFLGNVLGEQGDLAGALVAYRESLAVSQRLAAADGSNAGWQRDVSVSLDNVGNVLRAQGDLAGALVAYRESLAVIQRLAAADGSNAGWQRDVSVSQNNVGNVLRAQGDLAGALVAYRESLAVSQRLAAADGSNAGWQRDVSISQNNVGNVLRAQGDLAGALVAYRESLAVRQRLAAADASNAGWQRDVSVSLDNVGNVLGEQGDLAGALVAYRESLAVSQRLAAADGSNAGWQRDVSVSQNNVGNVLREQGDLAGALVAYRESLAVSQRLAAADGSNAGWQRDVSVSLDNVGNVLRAQGDLAGALVAYRESLAVSQRLAAADGSNAGWQRDVSVSLDNVGNVLRAQGDLAGALVAYRESLAVIQRLAAADGSNAGWQRDLSYEGVQKIV